MAGFIFYSWQNDLECKTHHYYIENCIKKSLKIVKKEAKVIVDYDRDTKGLNGSPDITTTIFDKIEKSVLFICDVSIVNQGTDNKKTPNPNVLIELGFAVHKLGWDRIICLFDINSGNIEELPFDIRQKRVTKYDPTKANEADRISRILADNIQSLYIKGQMFNPLNDYMKGRIDRSILSIAKQMANLVFGTVTMKDGLSRVTDLLNLPEEKRDQLLCQVEFPAFIVLNTFSQDEDSLKLILNELLSSSYFPKEWSYTVLELLDWLRQYNYLISSRNKNFPFVLVEDKDYTTLAVIDGKSINPQNPKNSFLVLETLDNDGKRYVDTVEGKVINITQYPAPNGTKLIQCFTIRAEMVTTVSEKIHKFIKICDDWLNTTNGEFILDPEYYWIE